MPVITMHSLNDPSVTYNIDLDSLTCSCEHFLNRTYRYDHNDPRRLCKHLVKALIQYGIPSGLMPYERDIIFFAGLGMAFSNREKLKKSGKIPIEPGSIQTITAEKKTKYFYLTGKVNDTIIIAQMNLKDGATTFYINNYSGSYNPSTKMIATLKSHKYLADAIAYWLDEERQKLNI